MSNLVWSEAQMRRIEPYFPRSHGVPRVDDRRILSGIVFVIRNGLRWRDAPANDGPHKPVSSEVERTIYNRHGKKTCRDHQRVEIIFGRLKDWRRIHTATTDAPTPSCPPSPSPPSCSSGCPNNEP